MDEKQIILIRIMARTDAIFWPHRSWTGQIQAVLGENRKRFADGGGVPWHSGSGRGGSKVNQARSLTDLEKAGAVHCFRELSKIRYARLEEKSEAWARAAVGLNSETTGILSLSELAAAKADPNPREGWISELALCDRGFTYGADCLDDEIRAVQNLILPALVAGLVSANSTVLGHVFYKITDSGRQRLAARVDVDNVADDSCYIQAAHKIYLAEFGDFSNWLHSQTPEKTNELYSLPLSAG